MTTQEAIARYLKACRHDIAHLNGASAQDIDAWVVAHQIEAVAIYDAALHARIAEGSEGSDASEHAHVAVKRWAQGDLFRG
jgi:hypothetical protein